MTHLRKMMHEELERRHYSQATTRRYLRFVERFAQHFGKSPDKLSRDPIRTYQAYLLKVRKLDPGSVENHVAALRFFFVHTLHRHEFSPVPALSQDAQETPQDFEPGRSYTPGRCQQQPFRANAADGSLRLAHAIVPQSEWLETVLMRSVGELIPLQCHPGCYKKRWPGPPAGSELQ